MFKTRDRYHMKVLWEWINTSPVPPASLDLLKNGQIPDDSQFHKQVYRELMLLSIGQEVMETVAPRAEILPWAVSYENALFALELEKMMGQLQDAADTALSNPIVYPELYLFLTAGGNPMDIENWASWAPQPPVVGTIENRAEAKIQSDTYARLRTLIRRKLDALQLTASYRWRTLNQFYSLGVGAFLLFLSLLYMVSRASNGMANMNPGDWVLIILASLIGGIVAPVAKDLVVARKRVRSGG